MSRPASRGHGRRPRPGPSGSSSARSPAGSHRHSPGSGAGREASYAGGTGSAVGRSRRAPRRSPDDKFLRDVDAWSVHDEGSTELPKYGSPSPGVVSRTEPGSAAAAAHGSGHSYARRYDGTPMYGEGAAGTPQRRERGDDSVRGPGRAESETRSPTEAVHAAAEASARRRVRIASAGEIIAARPSRTARPIKVEDAFPFVDAETGETVKLNRKVAESPRSRWKREEKERIEAERRALEYPKVKSPKHKGPVTNAKEMQAARVSHDEALLAMVEFEMLREKKRLMQLNRELDPLKRKWVQRTIHAERQVARRHIIGVRHDAEFVIAQKMASLGFLK